MDDFGPEDFPDREILQLSMSNKNGFDLSFVKSDEDGVVRLYQEVFGETIYIMSMCRHDVAKLIYQLEDFI